MYTALMSLFFTPGWVLTMAAWPHQIHLSDPVIHCHIVQPVTPTRGSGAQTCLIRVAEQKQKQTLLWHILITKISAKTNSLSPSHSLARHFCYFCMLHWWSSISGKKCPTAPTRKISHPSPQFRYLSLSSEKSLKHITYTKVDVIVTWPGWRGAHVPCPHCHCLCLFNLF